MNTTKLERSLYINKIEPPEREWMYAIKFVQYLMPDAPLQTQVESVNAMLDWDRDGKYILATARQFDPMVEIAIRQEYVADLLAMHYKAHVPYMYS